jgi:hypothetical protein
MKPKNTNLETVKFLNQELKFSFKHSEMMDENTMDIDVYIDHQEIGNKKSHLVWGHAKIKVYMPTPDIYRQIAFNKDSTWEHDMIDKIYNLKKQEIRADFSDFADLEYNPSPFFTLNSISIKSAKVDEFLHYLLQAFLRQYEFGVFFVCPSLLKDNHDLTDNDIKNVTDFFKQYGFESFDENEEYQYLEFESIENSLEQDEKYYDRNLVLWKWYRNDIVQGIMRDLESINHK